MISSLLGDPFSSLFGRTGYGRRGRKRGKRDGITDQKRKEKVSFRSSFYGGVAFSLLRAEKSGECEGEERKKKKRKEEGKEMKRKRTKKRHRTSQLLAKKHRRSGVSVVIVREDKGNNEDKTRNDAQKGLPNSNSNGEKAPGEKKIIRGTFR